MRFIAPNKLLAFYAVANTVLCLVITQNLGWPSFIALMMLNFFLSIMFPTIFSLGLKDLGEHTQQASSFIVMGVVGGALFPPVMGLIANHNVAAAYYLPIICYAVIFLFGWKFYKVETENEVILPIVSNSQEEETIDSVRINAAGEVSSIQTK
jgi:FHS family L-fucose permease-like MFS transporter